MPMSERERARRNAKMRELESHARYSAFVPPPLPRVDEQTLRIRRAEIPDDTRSITAFLMGDPLPGRRAIDQRARA